MNNGNGRRDSPRDNWAELAERWRRHREEFERREIELKALFEMRVIDREMIQALLRKAGLGEA